MDEPVTWDELHGLMEELRAMARALLALEKNAQSLQPTALVNRALERQKLTGVKWSEVTWLNRNYFFAAARKAMILELIDHARGKKARKRASIRPVQSEDFDLINIVGKAEDCSEQIAALFLGLKRLRALDPKGAEIAEHRYLSRYTVEETARVMKIGEKTVRRWWDKARVLLQKEVHDILETLDIIEISRLLEEEDAPRE